MTEAIFGLVGVVIGGLISVGASWMLVRRTERSQLRVAARMVSIELFQVHQLLELWLKLDSMRYDWWASPLAWPEYRATLAGGLTGADWTTVRRIYDSLAEVEDGIADIKSLDDLETIRLRCRLQPGDESRARMEQRVALCSDAIKILDAKTGDPGASVVHW